MLGENIKALKDKMIELSEGKKSYKMPKRAKGSKPDFLDVDKDGDKKEPMKKAVKDKAVKEETGKFDKTSTTWTDKSGKKHPAQRVTRKTDQLAQGTEDEPIAKKAKKVKEAAKPDFLDMDKDGDKKEPMKKAVNDKKKVKESAFKHNVKFVNESLQYLINEDEEGKAKAITAASDIVNDFTSWMQRVGQYQTKAIIELADAIKADFGAAEAEAFKQSVAPALAATLETLTSQREAISSAVAVLAGEAAPEEPMGQEPGMDMPPEPGMDMSAPDEMNAEPAGDEFAGADAAAGAGTTGREMRESKFARKLAESHSILSKLAK